MSTETANNIMPAKGMFIDNRWRASSSGATIDVYAPAEGAVFVVIGGARMA
jgi:aldehyde dehydrogenase (NAD+)